jgi:hypothetical protein
MTIIILALLGLLAVPLYFLRLLADGRELREKLRERQEARASTAPDEPSSLITSDHGSWVALPTGCARTLPRPGRRFEDILS